MWIDFLFNPERCLYASVSALNLFSDLSRKGIRGCCGSVCGGASSIRRNSCIAGLLGRRGLVRDYQEKQRCRITRQKSGAGLLGRRALTLTVKQKEFWSVIKRDKTGSLCIQEKPVMPKEIQVRDLYREKHSDECFAHGIQNIISYGFQSGWLSVSPQLYV